MVIHRSNYIFLELIAMIYFIYKVYTDMPFDYLDWIWISALIKAQYE
jgi:hypothetical protein